MKFIPILILVAIILILPISTWGLAPIAVGSPINATVVIQNVTGQYVDSCSPDLLFYFPEDNYTINNSVRMTENPSFKGQYNATTPFIFEQVGTWTVIANCSNYNTDGFLRAEDQFLVLNELPLTQYQNTTSHISSILGNISLVLSNQTEILNRLSELNLTLTSVMGNITDNLIIKLDNITSNVNKMQDNVTDIYHWAENTNITVFNIESKIDTIDGKIDTIDSNVDTILTNTNTIIEDLDCDTTSDTPICQRIIDINNTSNAIHNLIINNTLNQNNFTNIISNVTEIWTFTDSLEQRHADLQANISTLLNELGNITNNVTEIWTFTDSLEQRHADLQANISTLLDETGNITYTIIAMNNTIDTIDSNVDTILTNTNTIIEDLDCDTTSDTPICQRIIDINNTSNAIHNLIINNTLNQNNLTNILNNVTEIWTFTDSLEQRHADLQANVSTILTDIGSVASDVTIIAGYTDTLEDGQSQIISALLEINSTEQGNFSFVFNMLQDINQSADNIETNTNTIITNVNNLNFSTNISFYNINGNLSNIFNDTQTILTHLNCTTSTENFICDKISQINGTTDTTTINNIWNEIQNQQDNLTKLLFYSRTRFEKFKIVTFEHGDAGDGWEKQFFMRIWSTGITTTPTIHLEVPVSREEDILLLNNIDQSIPFTFKQSLLGTYYITFEPQNLPTCESSSDTTSDDFDCPYIDYKVWVKNYVEGGDIAVFNSFSEAKQQSKSLFDNISLKMKDNSRWILIIGGILIFMVLYIILFQHEVTPFNKKREPEKRIIKVRRIREF
ncbi:MAG: hypothetical protein Q8P20_07925 [bacterium]|nr:hypothetical protein [bacterium]